ncbi:hypothetical protein HGRIS_003377 [Hohenbuehelia grisea]|uniref:Uncharacterized protein n=1 Tax=Hohenbuehelia grisea TaxID=104357 RepID=A0ABR3JF71_9AGAR
MSQPVSPNAEFRFQRDPTPRPEERQAFHKMRYQRAKSRKRGDSTAPLLLPSKQHTRSKRPRQDADEPLIKGDSEEVILAEDPSPRSAKEEEHQPTPPPPTLPPPSTSPSPSASGLSENTSAERLLPQHLFVGVIEAQLKILLKEIEAWQANLDNATLEDRVALALRLLIPPTQPDESFFGPLQRVNDILNLLDRMYTSSSGFYSRFEFLMAGIPPDKLQHVAQILRHAEEK